MPCRTLPRAMGILENQVLASNATPVHQDNAWVRNQVHGGLWSLLIPTQSQHSNEALRQDATAESH